MDTTGQPLPSHAQAAAHWLRQLAADGPPAGFSVRQLGKGALLSTPTVRDNLVFIVHEGRMRVYLAGENRELTLAFLDAGDVYTTHTPTYVEAVAPTTLWVVDTPTFARRLTSDPSVTPVMMRVLGNLLANAVGLIEDLAFREVPARLARFLLGLANRRGLVCDEGLLVPLDLGLEDIASLLGTTRQTVSLLINQWEREGFLQRQGRRTLLVRSLRALAERCPDPAA